MADSSLVHIDALVVGELSYALAHNRVPVVQRLTLVNTGDEALQATVKITVEDAQGRLGEPVRAARRPTGGAHGPDAARSSCAWTPH